MAKDKSVSAELVSREYTINLGKRLHNITFKKRAPRALKEIRKFASQQMNTKEVSVDPKLNKAVWSQGIKNVPRRLRIVIERKRSEGDDAEETLYSFVTLAEDQNTKGKGVVVLDA